MSRKRLSITLVALLLLALGGCSEPAEQPGNGKEAAPEEVALPTLGELPTEPGTAWDMARYEGVEPLQVAFTVAGPWVFPSAEGWKVTTTEIVTADEVPGIDQFGDYDFIVRSDDFGEQAFYPRRIADGWMLQLGRSTEAGAEPYEEPLRLWPVQLQVGEAMTVLEGENFRVDATVLALGSATVPAGEMDDAYLVRFDYTPLTAGAIEGRQYYILAPEIGVVATFGVAAGDEETGLTALDGVSVLTTLPAKR